MSNKLRGIKRQRKISFQSNENICEKKRPQTKMAMNYECRDCGKVWRMWLQTGLEEHGENHKPVPFAIGCKHCNGVAYHINWHEDIELDEPIDITDDMDYFANVSDCDCGKPVYSQKRGGRQ